MLNKTTKNYKMSPTEMYFFDDNVSQQPLPVPRAEGESWHSSIESGLLLPPYKRGVERVGISYSLLHTMTATC